MNYGRVFNSFQEMFNAKEEEAKSAWRFTFSPGTNVSDVVKKMVEWRNKCKEEGRKCGDKKKPRGK